MSHVLTAIAAPGLLDAAVAVALADALVGAGARAGAPAWLAPAEAVDLPFAGADPAAVEAAARHRLAGLPVDLAALPAVGRRKRLLIADMDATITTGESLDELAEVVGIGSRIAAITERAMRGELAFEPALRERVALLAGVPVTALGEAASRIALTPGAVVLVRTMRAHGAFAALVSGGFDGFTARVAAACGFDRDLANRLEIVDGRLSGRVIEPILGRDAKRAALAALAAERGVAVADTVAVGDGANDIAMIRAAGLGVAFRGKPALVAVAPVRIDHADLTALLYLQGYRRDQFVPV